MSFAVLQIRQQPFNQFPDIPYRSSFDRRMLWSTVSKAFFRSWKITPLILSMSILYAQESIASSTAISVEWIARKRDWCLHSLSCSSKWAYNRSYNILSNTLTTAGITETGRRLFTLSRSSCLKRGVILTDF